MGLTIESAPFTPDGNTTERAAEQANSNNNSNNNNNDNDNNDKSNDQSAETAVVPSLRFLRYRLWRFRRAFAARLRAQVYFRGWVKNLRVHLIYFGVTLG